MVGLPMLAWQGRGSLWILLHSCTRTTGWGLALALAFGLGLGVGVRVRAKVTCKHQLQQCEVERFVVVDVDAHHSVVPLWACRGTQIR